MAVIDVDFVFSCSCFVSNIQCAMERSTKNFEIATHISSNHVIKNFKVDYFKNEKSIFVCCFDHLLNDMYYDPKNCPHYHRRNAISVIEEV